MNRSRVLTLTVFALVGALATSADASILTIDPAVDTADASGNETSNAAIAAIIAPIIAPATELYKQDVGGGESGSLAGSYTTTFSNDPLDPMDADITYDGGPIVGPTAWLLVKDGNQIPAWYLYNLTALGWDGMMEIELRNFWPDQGAISHVSLYGGEEDGGEGDIPEPASILVWSGLTALIGLVAYRRRRRS